MSKSFKPIRDYPAHAADPVEYERALRHNLSNLPREQVVDLAVQAAIAAERNEEEFLAIRDLYVADVRALPAKLREAAERARSASGKNAADALHDAPGGSRDKAKAIRAVWATGKYTTKGICAEEECAALEMTFDTARKALRNAPKPS